MLLGSIGYGSKLGGKPMTLPDDLMGRIILYLESQSTPDKMEWNDDADCKACDLLSEVLYEETGNDST